MRFFTARFIATRNIKRDALVGCDICRKPISRPFPLTNLFDVMWTRNPISQRKQHYGSFSTSSPFFNHHNSPDAVMNSCELSEQGLNSIRDTEAGPIFFSKYSRHLKTFNSSLELVLIVPYPSQKYDLYNIPSVYHWMEPSDPYGFSPKLSQATLNCLWHTAVLKYGQHGLLARGQITLQSHLLIT